MKSEFTDGYDPFPTIDHGIKAAGHYVMVQVRKPKERTASGLYVPDETKDAEHYNTIVCKVVSVGPVAFANYRDRSNGGNWVGGAWCNVGDFVMIGKYAGQRFKVDDVWFAMVTDDNILGKVNDPERVLAYIPKSRG